MNTREEPEEIRKRMKYLSERVNNALDHYYSHNRSVGILYEDSIPERCPRCGSGLKRKDGSIKGKQGQRLQRYQCLICYRNYFEREDKDD
jgi:hypothetical protein